MSVLLKLLKIAPTTLKPSLVSCPSRSIRTTPTLLWLNQKLSKFRSSKYKEQKFMEKDMMPESSKLIYSAPIATFVTWPIHVSTATAVLVTGSALYQLFSIEPVVDFIHSGLVMHSEDIYYFAVGFIAINAVMRFVVSMLPLRIYKDNGKYTAVFHAQLPGTMARHSFNQGEVKEVQYIFSPWDKASYKLGTKTTLIFEDYFKTPSEFHEMCAIRE